MNLKKNVVYKKVKLRTRKKNFFKNIFCKPIILTFFYGQPVYKKMAVITWRMECPGREFKMQTDIYKKNASSKLS